jgi:hypothetical protein
MPSLASELFDSQQQGTLLPDATFKTPKMSFEDLEDDDGDFGDSVTKIGLGTESKAPAADFPNARKTMRLFNVKPPSDVQ